MDKQRYNEEGFTDFLEQLIKSGRLNSTQVGITKLVIDKGYDALKGDQISTFDTMIYYNSVNTCKRCGDSIAWCEMLNAVENDKLCSGCLHQLEKLEKE